MLRRCARGILIICAISISALACKEAVQPVPTAGVVDSGAIRTSQARLQETAAAVATVAGQCQGVPAPGCTVTYTATPANYFCATNCEGYAVQTQPITVTFSKPVYQLLVHMNGPFLCSGMYGTVTVYNRVGTQVEQGGFTLEVPSDCGEDNITCCAVDTLVFPGGITQIVITPPQPWTFGDGGRAFVWYFYWFYEQRPPTAACPTGDELLDQQAMRDLLAALYGGSKPDSLPPRRREVRGFLYEDSTGNLVFGAYPDTTINPPLDTLMDTPCSSVGVPPPGSPLPGIPLAGGHSHPFTPGDTLPLNCKPTLPPGWHRLYDISRYGGPSKEDILSVADWGVSQYIIDKTNIYVAPIGTDSMNALSMVKSFPRVDPTGCTRP